MANIFSETWLTIRAIYTAGRDFFVKWFLPMHLDDAEPGAADVQGEEEEEGWFGFLKHLREDDDEEEPRRQIGHEQQPRAPDYSSPDYLSSLPDVRPFSEAGESREPVTNLSEESESESPAQEEDALPVTELSPEPLEPVDEIPGEEFETVDEVNDEDMKGGPWHDRKRDDLEEP